MIMGNSIADRHKTQSKTYCILKSFKIKSINKLMLIESIYMHILSLYLIIKGIIQIIIELSQAAAQTLSEGPRGHITIAFERLL